MGWFRNVPAVELTLVTRWDDVHHVALHPELFTADVDSSPLARTLGPNVLTVDGERQKRIRATMDPSMRPKAVAGYAPGVIEPNAPLVLPFSWRPFHGLRTPALAWAATSSALRRAELKAALQ